MSERSLLRRNLKNAWNDTALRYGEGIINSERGLQVHFVHHLFEQFVRAGVERQVFVEPCFRDSCQQLRSPDLVICNSRNIIGVVELKYLPRIRPKYAKDLRTLAWFARGGERIRISNVRYLGKPLPKREFLVVPDAVLCWAGFYRSPNVVMELPDGLAPERLLCMHALTSERLDPNVVFDSGNDA
jgi:hypothetical protein